jgi:hypothetical protein
MIDRAIVGWRIFYSDGSVFSSLDGEWSAASVSSVQVVVIYYTSTYQYYKNDENQFKTYNYKQVLNGKDFYWKKDGLFYMSDVFEEIPYEVEINDVKMGKLLTDKEFFNIYNLAADLEKAP